MYKAYLLFCLAMAGGIWWSFGRFDHQASQVHHSFYYGQREGRKGTPAGFACQNYLDQQKIFCIEGYFNGWSHLELKNSDFKMVETFKRAVQNIGPENGFLMSVWAVAFGIAASETDLPIEKLASPMSEKSPWVFAYIVDGWALMEQHRRGAEATLSACQNRVRPNFQNACLWGLGRSLFFYENPRVKTFLENKRIAAGFEFASNFTRNSRLSPNEIAELPRSARQIAELGKYAILKTGPTLISNAATLESCLINHHAADCAF